MRTIDRANKWIVGHDTGTSSKAIWAVMMGVVTETDNSYTYDIPHDPDDFGRCHRLLLFIPEWKKRLSEVAFMLPKWEGLVREWDKLIDLYYNSPNTLYDYMKSIRANPT